MSAAKSKAKKKPAAKKTTKKKQDENLTFSEMIEVLARYAGWVALVAVLGGLALSAGALEDRVADIRSDPLEAHIQWPTIGNSDATWMPARVRDGLTRRVLASVAIDPSDGASLEKARELLASTGWFSDGPRLARRPGGVIEVRGTWRQPAAAVEVAGEAHVVAHDGRRLPLSYSAGETGELRFIRGAWGDTPDPGEEWGGDDVEKSIALLRELRKSEAWPGVAGVDASGFVRTRVLSVITTDGARVVWGSAPGEEAVGQVDQAVRIARLESLLTDPAWIGAGRPRVELHLPRPVINESASGD